MLIHYLDKAKLLSSVVRCSVMCHFQAVKNNYAFIKTVEDAVQTKSFFGRIFDTKHCVLHWPESSIYGLFCIECSSIHKLAHSESLLCTYSSDIK